MVAVFRQSSKAMEDASAPLNAATFSLEDEDHTLANALRFMLNKRSIAACRREGRNTAEKEERKKQKA